MEIKKGSGIFYEIKEILKFFLNACIFPLCTLVLLFGLSLKHCYYDVALRCKQPCNATLKCL